MGRWEKEGGSVWPGGSVLRLWRGGRRFWGSGRLDLESEPGADSGLEARVFTGYSGWGPGQLESELSSRSWFVVDASADDVFTSKPEHLWEEVLRRAGGRYAWFATYPADPRLN